MRSADTFTLEALEVRLSVCKVADAALLPKDGEFVFTGRTDNECSLVCPTALVPAVTSAREDGWRAFRVRGTLEFSLVGVLAGISAALAREGIGIFVISTYDTDYVLTRACDFQRALETLGRAGYSIA